MPGVTVKFVLAGQQAITRVPPLPHSPSPMHKGSDNLQLLLQAHSRDGPETPEVENVASCVCVRVNIGKAHVSMSIEFFLLSRNRTWWDCAFFPAIPLSLEFSLPSDDRRDVSLSTDRPHRRCISSVRGVM